MIMNKIKCLISSLSLLCLMQLCYGQVAMHSWASHFSYSNTKQVAITNDKVYGLSYGALYSVDKKHESIETYSKITGLSDGTIDLIKGNGNTLIVVYANMNIDLIVKDEIFNISDLKRKDISGKRVYDICFHDRYAYLSCGFGIVALNLDKKEIADSYFIGENGSMAAVLSSTIAGDSIYALMSDKTIKAANVNSNLLNFENWKVLSSDDVEADSPSKIISFGKNNMFLIDSDVVYNRQDGNWKVFLNGKFSNIEIWNDYVTISSTKENLIKIFDKDLKICDSINVANFNVIYDNASKCAWSAHGCLYKIENGAISNSYLPNGPSYKDMLFAKVRNGRLITGYGEGFSTAGILQIYDGNNWKNITQANIGEEYAPYFFTLLDAEVDPRDPRRMYLATWRSVFELYDDVVVKRYLTGESSLELCTAVGDPNVILIDGLSFDKDNNLWMLNMQAGDLIHVKDTDGNWHHTSYNNSKLQNTATARPPFISSDGKKWILFPRLGVGVFVIEDNGTPLNFSDDKTKLFTSFSDGSPEAIVPSTYRCIAEDKNGDIWLGTDVGPLIFKNTEEVMNSGYTVERIKITREDNAAFADYLLATEQINAIAVDGANRKWIGTASSGVYLLSDDGQETIYHFTTENSPLTSDIITAIDIDKENGIVYIVTSEGLFSFGSDASEGRETYDDVYVYPNPVRPDFYGDITVTGLMENSEVRVTTLNGELIYHGLSNGGTFIWDGKSVSGRRVASGIYLIFATTSDGTEKMVSKIAFVK